MWRPPPSPARRTRHTRILLQTFIAGLLAWSERPKTRTLCCLNRPRRNVAPTDWCSTETLIYMLRAWAMTPHSAKHACAFRLFTINRLRGPSGWAPSCNGGCGGFPHLLLFCFKKSPNPPINLWVSSTQGDQGGSKYPTVWHLDACNEVELCGVQRLSYRRIVTHPCAMGSTFPRGVRADNSGELLSF